MSKRTVLKNISLLLALVAIVYFVANYTGLAKNTILSLLNVPGTEVKGASTKRAEEISDKLGSDIGNLLEQTKIQALQFTLGDAITGLSHLQKVPQDIHSMQEFTTKQIDSVLKSRQK
ncbi:hypothetical protein HY310_00190 [Candidatus Microgenomates bacterium]|nr:hypothetical protein [Candidatus Microgenomates bacterium]